MRQISKNKDQISSIPSNLVIDLRDELSEDVRGGFVLGLVLGIGGSAALAVLGGYGYLATKDWNKIAIDYEESLRAAGYDDEEIRLGTKGPRE